MVFYINMLQPHAEEPRSGVSKHGGQVKDFGIWYYSKKESRRKPLWFLCCPFTSLLGVFTQPASPTMTVSVNGL
jgi:hypothetical protein